MSTKLTTGLVRFSYLQVFEARAMQEGQTKKFSVSLIIPKKDKKTLKAIKKAINEAKEIGKSSKWGGKIPKTLKLPLRDGEEREDEVYEGMMFVNANSVKRVGVVDADLNEIIEQDEIGSGDYGRASITFYPYNSNGSKGIACGLQGVQKLKDGGRLDGGTFSADEAFGKDLADDGSDLF